MRRLLFALTWPLRALRWIRRDYQAFQQRKRQADSLTAFRAGPRQLEGAPEGNHPGDAS